MKLKDKPPEEEEPEADSFGNLYEDKGGHCLKIDA